MSKMSGDGYVTTRELASELRSMRWEFRFLLALQTVGILTVGAKLGVIPPVPGVEQALSVIQPFIQGG